MLWAAAVTEGSALRPLGAVLGAALPALADAGAVERAAHRVVAHAREVLDAATADQHHRVLLQVVALAADVADHLVAVGEAHLGDLAQRRVRLLRGRRVHARADAALLRRAAQGGHLALGGGKTARGADQLIDGRHARTDSRSGRRTRVIA